MYKMNNNLLGLTSAWLKQFAWVEDVVLGEVVAGQILPVLEHGATHQAGALALRVRVVPRQVVRQRRGQVRRETENTQ